jgi:hypothetical protein
MEQSVDEFLALPLEDQRRQIKEAIRKQNQKGNKRIGKKNETHENRGNPSTNQRDGRLHHL